MLLKTEGGLQPGHRPQKRIGRNRSCVVGCLKHTPLFLEKISCLVLILGLSHDSGHGLCLEGGAKSRDFFACSRTILGRESGGVPDSRSGWIMGDFVNQKSPVKPLLRREVESLRPPFFLERSLSPSDSRRVLWIRAWSRLGSAEDYLGLQRGLSPVLDVHVQILNQG